MHSGSGSRAVDDTKPSDAMRCPRDCYSSKSFAKCVISAMSSFAYGGGASGRSSSHCAVGDTDADRVTC